MELLGFVGLKTGQKDGGLGHKRPRWVNALGARSEPRRAGWLASAIGSPSSVSRARIPRSFPSFNLLRLKVKRDILIPDPISTVEGRVQKAFPEPGKFELARKLMIDR
jgi:hypothetical protein